ncbi:MAG: DUF1269 domain-containing protein [Holophagales bacterium]|nr:DUF1269 domain-containing protein [Holophagales bacterium]
MTRTTSSTQEHAIVAIYETHTTAEAAVRALQGAGVDMKRLSIIGRDFQSEENVRGYYTTEDKIMVWGGRGAFWGGLWGVLVGGGVFLVPAIGPLVVMGPLVGWMVGALEGAALGGVAGVVAAALSTVGIPEESVIKYEVEVKAGKFLVLARGSADMVEHARALLGTTGASHVAIHAPSTAVAMNEAERAAYVTRDGILKLLSDDEVGRVSNSETKHEMAAGEEYVDLADLGRGVQRAGNAKMEMADLLPRKSVREETWRRIVEELTAAQVAPELVAV